MPFYHLVLAFTISGEGMAIKYPEDIFTYRVLIYFVLLSQNTWDWVIYEQEFIISQFWRLEVQNQGTGIQYLVTVFLLHPHMAEGTRLRK